MRSKTRENKPDGIEPAGYRPSCWARAVGFSRQKLYALGADIKPHSIKIGRMRIITESPADWLARVGAAK